MIFQACNWKCLTFLCLFFNFLIFVKEEELRARKREALMQQSRREAQLSRLRFEEERLKVRDILNNFVVNCT